MVDLLPLLVFTLTAGVGLSIALVVRGGRIRWSGATRGLLLLVGAAVAAAPYVAFLAVDGDPDVWDFYRSVWFAPLAVLAGLAAYVAYLFHGRRRG